MFRMENLESRTMLSTADWIVSDDYAGASSEFPSASATSIVQDPAGNVYATGTGVDSQGQSFWLVRKGQRSAEGTWSWSELARVNLPYASIGEAYLYTDAGDQSYILAAGEYHPAASISAHWAVVKVRTDGAGGVQLVDDFQWGGRDLYGHGNGISGQGSTIYVSGCANEPYKGTTSFGIVRKSTDGGEHWTTVLDMSKTGGARSYANDVLVTASGVYLTGYTVGSSGAACWLTQRSTDGGATWQTVDDYRSMPEYAAKSMGFVLGADAWGHVYAVGTGTTTTKTTTRDAKGRLVTSTTYQDWTVTRRSPSGNLGTWETIDAFSGGVNNLQPSAFAADAAGNLYMSAQVKFASDNMFHWVVRKSVDTNIAGDSSYKAWSTIDDYCAGVPARANSILPLADGDLLVAGWSGTAGNQHWTIRELPA